MHTYTNENKRGISAGGARDNQNTKNDRNFETHKNPVTRNNEQLWIVLKLKPRFNLITTCDGHRLIHVPLLSMNNRVSHVLICQQRSIEFTYGSINFLYIIFRARGGLISISKKWFYFDQTYLNDLQITLERLKFWNCFLRLEKRLVNVSPPNFPTFPPKSTWDITTLENNWEKSGEKSIFSKRQLWQKPTWRSGGFMVSGLRFRVKDPQFRL